MDQGRRAVIEIVTALVRDTRGHVLLVRKRGTGYYLQPGGKREPGESDLDALARELREELGCSIVAGSAKHLGIFEAPAANEPGQMVRAVVYTVRLAGDIVCQAEIEYYIWVNPRDPGNTLIAPLTRDTILPLALAPNHEGQAL